MSTLAEALAYFLFARQADSYDADGAMRELAWADPFIRSFWLEEAGAVIDFIELDHYGERLGLE